MPSWNEKPHAVPTINVNLACGCNPIVLAAGAHAADCGRILIPCPVPRSVTFEVVLGECVKDPFGCKGERHSTLCPISHAHPVKVSCSISGNTWEESEVEDVEPHPTESPQRSEHWRVMLLKVGADTPHLRDARKHWALIKALVLGQPGPGRWDVATLFTQRDAVYAALADMVRAEEMLAKAWAATPTAIRNHSRVFVSVRTPTMERTSHHLLAAYIEHLIEQVGVMP